MAAGLASLIRGQDVVEDTQNLQVIAAEQLDVTPLAFNSVITTLEEAGFIADVRRAGNRIESFTEHVPFYRDLYEDLGANWRAAKPTELEQQVVLLVDALAHAPMAQDEVVDKLSLDTSEFADILEVAEQSELIQSIKFGSDRILYSPFFGFENPAAILEIVTDYGSGQLADAFGAIRNEQGMPLSLAGPVIEDAVSRGLLMAPSVELPSGALEAFATLPYSIDKTVLKGEKPILDKALAVIACLRTGQHFGGYSSLSPSALVAAINKLLTAGYIDPHSSSERQYRLLSRAGVIELAPDKVSWGKWRTPTLIDTTDNRAALLLARDLISHGESISSRLPNQEEIGKLLESDDPYGSPLKTVARYRNKKHLSDKQWQSAVDKMLGHK